MDLHPDLIDLLTEFENSGVEYLIVGGWAVGLHSEPRYTKDLDILIGTDGANLERVVGALERYGAPAGLIDEVRTMKDDEFVFFGVPPARVDLLRQIPGVDFAKAWTGRKTLQWHGVDVQVLGFDDLCEAKRAAGRPKDRDDLRKLERFKKA
jgi:hypothetical protein